MTSRQTSLNQKNLVASTTETRARLLMTFKATATDPIIARMDKIANLAAYDMVETGDAIRLRAGVIGGEQFTATVQEIGGELLIIFYCAARKHTRRILVTTDGRYLMQNGNQAVPISASCKYAPAINAIIRGRLN